MAQRRTRLHHYLWHGLRNSWLLLTDAERQAVSDVSPEWVPPRPALDAKRRPLRDNDSGEDFLFMHRRMLERVNAALSRQGPAGCRSVRGWERIPPPDDEGWPVPEFPDSGLEEVKSVDYYQHYLAPLERRYRDECYLRGVSLGQLGSDIEFTIHVGAHLRWAAPSAVGYRPPFPTGGGIEDRWDDPEYDYLGDVYASHVNPIFWMLHAWIDERVEDWRRAHGIAGDIAWKGTWVGPPAELAPHDQDAPAARREDDEWARVDRIISASGAAGCDGFFRPEGRLPLTAGGSLTRPDAAESG
jgi:hypothetical protein